MRFKKRCVQHPIILEVGDRMPISQPSRHWRWIFIVLLIALGVSVIFMFQV